MNHTQIAMQLVDQDFTLRELIELVVASKVAEARVDARKNKCRESKEYHETLARLKITLCDELELAQYTDWVFPKN